MYLAKIFHMKVSPWFLYIVRCKDGTLYTGISNDVKKRIETHNKGKGALFTKFRYPVRLVHQEKCGTRSDALKREYAVKCFKRLEKLALIKEARGAKRRTKSVAPSSSLA